jgi:hypothetical protein
MGNRHFWMWMVAGGAFLLYGRSIAVPRLANAAIVVFARSMLFVYLFYLQISLALPIKHFSVQLALGTLISIGLWILWESLRRTWRSSTPSDPRQSRGGSPVLAGAGSG